MSEEPKVVSEEKKLDPVEFGFDKEGYFRIKLHMSVGLWNILGALAEAHIRVIDFFGQITKSQDKSQKKLMRPDEGLLNKFTRRWQ